MLLVQEYLKSHSFADLGKDHGVYASFSKSGHKASINYDQIDSRPDDMLARECRGLILCAQDGKSFLDQAQMIKNKLSYDHVTPGETKILAYPMKRFLNYNQGHAEEIDWHHPQTSVLEKLDGSMLILYFDSIVNEWHTATRAVPEADMPLDGGRFTFRTLFERALMDTTGKTFEEFTAPLDKNFTYCFELTSPYNRIVVRYDTCRLTLLAARDISTLKEVHPQVLSDSLSPGFPHVQEFNFKTIDEVVRWASEQNPIEYEGLVVRDGNFNRIKVKNAQYVVFNKARDILGSSDRNALQSILAGTDDDFIPMMPKEIADNLIKIKGKLQLVIKHYDEIFKDALNQANQIEPGNKKVFAQIVNVTPELWTAPMFQIFYGNSKDMREFMQNSKKDSKWSDTFLDKILELCENIKV